MQTPENKNKAMADAMASAFEQKAKEQPSQQAAAAQPTAQVHSHAQPVTPPPAFNAASHNQQFSQATTGTNNMNNQNQQQNKQSSRLFGMNNTRKRVFSNQDFSENFRQAVDAISEHMDGYREEGFNKNFYILPLQQPNLSCSSLLYVGTYSADNKTLAFAFTMMLENTSAALRPVTGQDNMTGERFEIARMPGSQFDNIYFDAVVSEIRGKLGAGVEVYDAGATVIKSEMDWTNKAAINQLLNNAENATIAAANRKSGYAIEPPLNLKEEINPQYDRITLGFNFNTQPLYSFDGMPVRNDVEVKMSVSVDGGGQVQTAEPFVTVNGYVELIAATPQQIAMHQQQMFGSNPMMYQMNPQMMQQMGLTTPRYYPQFTITNSSTGISDAEGLEFQLLAFYGAYMVTTGGTWMHAFAPRMVDDLDIGDIGAINYELGMGVDVSDANARPQKIDTHDSSFTTQSLIQLLNAACFPEMSIAKDIEETGPRTWVDSAMLQAGGIPGTTVAQLSDVGKAAHQAIIDAANNLTGGEFGKLWTDTTKLIIVRDGSRIPGGYYVGKNGTKLDSRNVDLLAVLNFVGDSDPRLVEEWKMICSASSGMSVEKRTSLRQQYLKRFMGESYIQKCYYERIVATGDFMVTLVAACAAAGLAPTPENTNTQYNATSYGTPLASMYGVSTQTQNPLFANQQAFSNPMQQGYQAGFRTPFGFYRG
ncbi:hypothetical protein ABN214_15350 [Proteus terrae]|uniref:hypothetical protein n=1 Tax=Proteus terrae TaxID=1574161 RepID=UPI0032DB91C7